MTDSLQKILAEKRKAYKKFKLSQLTSDYTKYFDSKFELKDETRKNLSGVIPPW